MNFIDKRFCLFMINQMMVTNYYFYSISQPYTVFCFYVCFLRFQDHADLSAYDNWSHSTFYFSYQSTFLTFYFLHLDPKHNYLTSIGQVLAVFLTIWWKLDFQYDIWQRKYCKMNFDLFVSFKVETWANSVRRCMYPRSYLNY